VEERQDQLQRHQLPGVRLIKLFSSGKDTAAK
jgi:hypothetical protein